MRALLLPRQLQFLSLHHLLNRSTAIGGTADRFQQQHGETLTVCASEFILRIFVNDGIASDLAIRDSCLYTFGYDFIVLELCLSNREKFATCFDCV
jgi:hypothetical protein